MARYQRPTWGPAASHGGNQECGYEVLDDRGCRAYPTFR